MEKYEYLTNEDLRYKPGVVEQAKLEHSPLGKIFNKGLPENDRKDAILNRLKNVEDNNKEQLKAIRNKEKNN